mgnify:CR=1 FL=1
MGSLNTQVGQGQQQGLPADQGPLGAGVGSRQTQNGQKNITDFAGLEGAKTPVVLSPTQEVGQPSSQDLMETRLMHMFSRMLETKLQSALAPVGTDIATIRNNLVEVRDHVTPLEQTVASLQEQVAGIQTFRADIVHANGAGVATG